MRRILAAAFLFVLVISGTGFAGEKKAEGKAAARNAGAQAESALKARKEKISYALGLNIGSSLKAQAVDVDMKMMQKGIEDALSGAKPAYSKEEMQEAITSLQKEMFAKQTARLKQESEKNKKEGEAFLAENARKPGVVTTASGLQYKIIKEGTGAKPKATDTVTVNYRGTLPDGTEFDSSYKRGEPATFKVNEVIPGWTEALQLMKAGSKFQLVIPARLAYGEQSPDPKIGPNRTLIFDVELISINAEAKRKESK